MDLIDSQRLRVFVLLAKAGSFVEVAEELSLTASAVSHAVKTLEGEMGCALFERRGAKSVMTPAGERLLVHALRILEEMREAHEGIRELTSWGRGYLRVGAPASFCRYMLPEAVLEFRECFPGCELSIMATDGADGLALMVEGKLDLVLAEAGDGDAEVVGNRVFADDLIFIASPNLALAGRKRVGLKDLVKDRLLVHSLRSAALSSLQKELVQIGGGTRNFQELGSYEGIKEMVRIGLGVGIVPWWVCEEELAEGAFVKLPVFSVRMQRSWEIFRLKRKSLSLIPETFQGLCETVGEDLALRRGIF